MPVRPLTEARELPARLLVEEHARVVDALRRAVRDALVNHARLGNRVATWRDGVVEVDAAEALEALDETQGEE